MVVKDVVCGMELDESNVRARAVWNGRDYSFCSEGCKQTFDRQPDAFAWGASAKR